MAIEQPQSSDALDSPDHAALHRVIAASTSANVESIAVYDDSTVRTPEMFVMSNVSGKAIQVDINTPTYTWRDLTADLTLRNAGGSNPTYSVFRTNIRAYEFSVNNEMWVNFHIPHDYVEGTEMHIHTHWSLDAADTTNTVTWGFDCTYTKRDDVTPDAFPATTPFTVAHDCSAINVPQYGHVLSEVQVTTAGQLGGIDIELDGLILCRVYLNADTGSPGPFLFYVDLHYQSSNLGTKDKAFPYFG